MVSIPRKDVLHYSNAREDESTPFETLNRYIVFRLYFVLLYVIYTLLTGDIMAKVSRSYRFEVEIAETIHTLALQRNTSDTSLIEQVIMKEARASQEDAQEAPEDAITGELRARVAEQAETIKALTSALQTAQEATKAAQTLHAQALAALPAHATPDNEQSLSTDLAAPLTRWQRLKAAWRG